MFVVKAIDSDSSVTRVFMAAEYSIYKSDRGVTEARFENVGGQDAALCFGMDRTGQQFFIMNSDGKTIDRF